jgi:DNA-directed RNA polymerase subunit alpha
MGDLTTKSFSELTAIPNFGERSIEEVVEALTQIGLSLREE